MTTGWEVRLKKWTLLFILFRNFTKMSCRRQTSFKLPETLLPHSKKYSVLLQGNTIQRTILQLTSTPLTEDSIHIIVIYFRGRYDIKLYPTFLQLHGKTFDYKIPYTTILRLFLLPHKDGRQMFFVVRKKLLDTIVTQSTLCILCATYVTTIGEHLKRFRRNWS